MKNSADASRRDPRTLQWRNTLEVNIVSPPFLLLIIVHRGVSGKFKWKIQKENIPLQKTAIIHSNYRRKGYCLHREGDQNLWPIWAYVIGSCDRFSHAHEADLHHGLDLFRAAVCLPTDRLKTLLWTCQLGRAGVLECPTQSPLVHCLSVNDEAFEQAGTQAATNLCTNAAVRLVRTSFSIF